MSVKSVALGLCVCMIAAGGARAANVSFLVMETGLPPGSSETRYSALWEDGLLEVFFESGHIVSNAPRMRLTNAVVPEGFPPEARKDYEDARNGGMDYFLIAIVDHSSQNVSLRLFSTRSLEPIAEKAYAGGSAASPSEERESVRRAVSAMAAFLR